MEYGVLRDKPDLAPVLKSFLNDFDVNWGKDTSGVTAFYLRPASHIQEMFGLDREILLLHSNYNIDGRIFNTASQILSEDSAKNRLDPLVFIIVSPSPDLFRKVERMAIDNAQARVAVPFAQHECVGVENSALISQRFQKYLSSRDLFDYELPIATDLYFFGRNESVVELRDSVRRGVNVGLFGLRKTGKTSLIFKLQRALKEDQGGELIYIDCQNAAVYQSRWWELTQEIINRLSGTQGKPVTEATAATVLQKTVTKLARRNPGKRFVIALDEIEHISPNIGMRKHWDNDFLDFWKTLRAIQNTNRHLSFLVAGVNATVVETPTYSGHDNPLFSLIKTKYIPSFERGEVKQMVSTLGRYMGLHFSEDVFDYLHLRYGGHPLLIRLACSYTHKSLDKASLPVTVVRQRLEMSEQECDQSLFAHANHILGVLTEWYPEEYEMLEYLAEGKLEQFADVAEELPQYAEHLKQYRLVSGVPPKFTMPVLGQFVKARARARNRVAARKQKDRTHEDLSKLLEVSALRNELEPRLRRFVKRVLKAHMGSERWIDPILQTIPDGRRKKLMGVDRDTILSDHLFLLDLIQLIHSQWKYFEVLDKGPKGTNISKEKFTVLLDYVNDHREDAHAKAISDLDMATLRTIVPLLERIVDQYLED